MTWNPRRLLLAACLGLLVPAWPGQNTQAQEPAKKVLFFTKSSGFQHSVITRQGEELAHAERILVELGKKHGFEVVPSKDGRMFDPDKIGQWDAFAFYTTGDLTQAGTDGQPPMSPAGKQALLEAIRGGKGFVGFHCASDTFHSRGDQVDEFITMVGGEFSGHGAQQEAKITVVDPKFPGAGAFGSEFELMEEWYAQRNINDDLHVLMVQNTEGMEGPDYQRPNYPMTWARQEGDGRVFYTAMGHREDVWENPRFQELAIGGLKWVTGQAEADVTPNVTRITPGFREVGKK